MIFTGERVILGQGDADLLNEHVARYRFAQRFSQGQIVLDAACGSGYGSALLAENAGAVFGVDISQEAVDYARSHFAAPNLRFSVSDCMALPFAAAQFDLVVAFEIIEHLQHAEEFLQELDRVLKPSGLLLLSTPNRLYYTEERGEVNPFHQREFSFPEFEELLRPLFAHRSILFENHVPGLLIADAAPADRLAQSMIVRGQQNGQSAAAEEARRGAYFFVAVCSHQPLDAIAPLLYLPSTGNVLREREKHIRELTRLLADADAEAERARLEVQRAMEAEQQVRAGAQQRLDEKEAEIAELRRQYEARLAELRAELESRTEWARTLDAELKEKGDYLTQLQAEHDSKVQWAVSQNEELEKTRAALQRLQQEFDERTAWALQLQAELRVLYASWWHRFGRQLRLSPLPPSDRQ